MKKLILLLGVLTIPSFAGVSANVAFSSDYFWRGMTQSDGPAMSGGFDYESESGFYAGIWGSNVNFNDGAGSELDYYAGYAFSLNEIGIDIGYVVFDYPENKTGLDFDEWVLGLSFKDLGLTFTDDTDDSDAYTEISYTIGDIAFSYGDYKNYGENFTISYGFTCGSFNCNFLYTDFSGETNSSGAYLYGPDEDGLVFSISASLGG